MLPLLQFSPNYLKTTDELTLRQWLEGLNDDMLRANMLALYNDYSGLLEGSALEKNLRRFCQIAYNHYQVVQQETRAPQNFSMDDVLVAIFLREALAIARLAPKGHAHLRMVQERERERQPEGVMRIHVIHDWIRTYSLPRTREIENALRFTEAKEFSHMYGLAKFLLVVTLLAELLD